MRGGDVTLQVRSREVIRCARCGHACAADAWLTQPPVRTLTRADLGACVTQWPSDAVVEVRACAGCGGAMARRRRNDLSSRS
jgi:hypothetical protein